MNSIINIVNGITLNRLQQLLLQQINIVLKAHRQTLLKPTAKPTAVNEAEGLIKLTIKEKVS